MKIRDILRTKGQNVFTVEPEVEIQEAMRTLVRHNIGSLVVFDESIRGIITERDLLRLGAEEIQRLATSRVRDLMTTQVITVAPDADIHDVMDLMTERRIRHLPIMEEDKLVGMISIGDVVNALRRTVEEENKHLHAYIGGAPL